MKKKKKKKKRKKGYQQKLQDSPQSKTLFFHYHWFHILITAAAVAGILSSDSTLMASHVNGEWSKESATKAYLEALQLCNDHKREGDSCKTQEPGSDEFISALAAGIRAELMVEVTTSASSSTVALASAARLTGSRFVCILPETSLDEAEKVIGSSLKGIVEFRTGDPFEILKNFPRIDFCLVDFRDENYRKLLKFLDGSEGKGIVVVANNLVGEKGKSVTSYNRERSQGRAISGSSGMKNMVMVRSMRRPGKGKEIITTIGKSNKVERRNPRGGSHSRGEIKGKTMKKSASGISRSKWIFRIDEESGEEHIFRVPRSDHIFTGPKSF